MFASAADGLFQDEPDVCPMLADQPPVHRRSSPARPEYWPTLISVGSVGARRWTDD